MADIWKRSDNIILPSARDDELENKWEPRPAPSLLQCRRVDAKKIKFVQGYPSSTVQCRGRPSKDGNRRVLTVPSTVPSTWSTWGLTAGVRRPYYGSVHTVRYGHGVQPYWLLAQRKKKNYDIAVTNKIQRSQIKHDHRPSTCQIQNYPILIQRTTRTTWDLGGVGHGILLKGMCGVRGRRGGRMRSGEIPPIVSVFFTIPVLPVGFVAFINPIDTPRNQGTR
jgi:hypothetical protein